MSQQVEDGSASPMPTKRWRVHKRTILVVFCVVILPWTLIAIPSTGAGSGATTGMSVSHYLHGWPWVHLESTNYTVSGSWVNKKFFPGQMPPGLDLAESAKEAAAGYTEDSPSVKLNLRLEHDNFRAQWLGEYSYWSNFSSWPTKKLGTHYTPRYLGLALNLISVALLAWCVAAICEYRIRRHHRLLKFSLANLLTATALFGILIAWISHIYHESAEKTRLNNALQTYEDNNDDNALLFFAVDYEARFPLIVSQLFNHGKHPWGAFPIFRKVKSGEIKIVLHDGKDPEVLADIAKLANETQYSVSVHVFDFSPQRQRMLHALDGLNIETLEVEFDSSYDWLYDQFGDEKDESEWEEARKQAGFMVDLDIDMSRLKEIWLQLDPIISQAEQLTPFVGLPSLEVAGISGLSTEGAEFILKSKKDWPKAMKFYSWEEVPEELQAELNAGLEQIPRDNLLGF